MYNSRRHFSTPHHCAQRNLVQTLHTTQRPEKKCNMKFETSLQQCRSSTSIFQLKARIPCCTASVSVSNKFFPTNSVFHYLRRGITFSKETRHYAHKNVTLPQHHFFGSDDSCYEFWVHPGGAFGETFTFNFVSLFIFSYKYVTSSALFLGADHPIEYLP